MHARQLEIAKYGLAYSHSEYAMGRKRRMAVCDFVRSVPPGSWLDVSTGRGETLGFADAAGHTAQGTEVVTALLNDRVRYAEAHKLPFAAGEFDYVSCFDVLEHLIEADIRPALSEMKRVAKRMCVVTAADFPHFYRGMDLHVSRRPVSEWDALIKSVWGEGAQYIDKLGISAAWRLDKHGH
jgi:ubiquinone/menaquinone biosynthesis C-methylase UbiE